MTEQELREKIAKLTFNPPWSCLNQESFAVNHHLLADQILALIKEALPDLAKEAGWKSPEEVEVIIKRNYQMGLMVGKAMFNCWTDDG